MAQNNDVLIPKKAIDGITQANTEIVKLDESTYKFIQTVEKLSKELKDNSITLEQVQKAQKKTQDNSKKSADITKQQQKAAESLDKQRQKGLAQLAKTEDKERQLQKALTLTVKSEQDLITKTNALVRIRKKLDVTTDSGRKKHAALTAEIRKNTIALKNSDKAIDRNQRNVGKYSTAIKGLGGQFLGALGITAGVYMFVGAMKDAFQTVFKFGQAQATLAATLGKTKEEIEDLTQSSIDYGKATKFTATEVSGLQNELAKLGFSAGEINILTGDVLNLAEATGGELAVSAKVTGIAIKAYGLSALEAGDITASLAIATTKSALSFQDYETILSTVGPVAKAYGFTLEDTLALQGKLKDSGFDASSSATALRNILLNLADANGDLAKELGGSVNNIEDLIPALIKLRDGGIDLNSTLQLTDKRSVAAFNALLAGSDDVLTLRDSLVGANEELEEMVSVKTDNVIDAMARTGSAWEGVVLKFRESEGFFVSFFDGLADKLNIISDGYLTTSEKIAGFFGNLFGGGIGSAGSAAISAQQKVRAEILKSVKTTSLEELNIIRSNYADQARAGDIFAKDVIKRVDAQLIAITESNRKASERDKQAILDAQAVVEKEKEKAAAKDIKLEQKRVEAAKTAAEQYKTTWATAVKELKTELKAQAGSEAGEFLTILDAELDAELAKIDEEVDAYTAGEEAKTDATEKEAAKRQAINEKLKEVGTAAINGAFDIYQNSLDRRSQANEIQKAHEIQLANGNKQEEERINAKYEAKEIELNKKKDKSERTQALFNIALSTAQAIASASPVVPLMILAAAFGAIQLAVVASTPLPQYWTGIDKVPTDSAVMVGDRGRELIEKDGKFSIANQPTITSGLKGAKVYNNKETEMMLNGRSGGSSIDISELKAEQKETNDLLRKMGKLPIHKKGTYDIFRDQIKYPV